jgi:hypothetical protein
MLKHECTTKEFEVKIFLNDYEKILSKNVLNKKSLG